LILFGSVMATVTGSTLLKVGSRTLSFDGAILGVIMSFITSPALIAGFAAYAVGAILWVFSLSQFDLSYATFVSSFQYILLLAVSILVFQEQISLMKWIGCAIILIGVIFWMKG